MPPSAAAAASAAAGWRRPSWPSCSPSSSPPRWKPPPRRCRGRRPATGSGWPPSSWPSSAPAIEAGRARRQYDAVEPENRLVARTLERAWEDRLAAVRPGRERPRAQQARRPVTLTSEELAWITTAGADIRAVFDAPTTTIPERKQLLRAVIAEIVAHRRRPAARRRPADHLAGRGSHRTVHALTKKGGHTRTTSEDTVDLVRRLAGHYDDKTIALILGQAAPAHRHRADLDQGPGPQPAGTRTSPHASRSREMSAPAAKIAPWSPSPRPQPSSASASTPSTGGCATGSSPASSSPPARPGASASTRRYATRSHPGAPRLAAAGPGRQCPRHRPADRVA